MIDREEDAKLPSQPMLLSRLAWLPLRLLTWVTLGNIWMPVIKGDVGVRSMSSAQVTKETFVQVFEVVRGEMERLILEAEGNMDNLNQLKDALLQVHGLVVQENVSLTTEREALLGGVLCGSRG